jgi:hypothetical protein
VQQSILPTAGQFATKGERMDGTIDALLGVRPKAPR